MNKRIMELQKQANGWSCGITSLSMLLGESVESLAKRIGHDGSGIILPDLPDPYRRRTFHMNEFVDVCHDRGYTLVEIPAISHQAQDTPAGDIVMVTHPIDNEARIIRYMDLYPGLIIGQYAISKWHMCAWDSESGSVYDPHGPRRYTFQDDSDHITVASFWAMIPRGVPPSL